jgi:hypothetical protein
MTVRILSIKCSPESNAFLGQIVSGEISWGVKPSGQHQSRKCGWMIVISIRFKRLD